MTLAVAASAVGGTQPIVTVVGASADGNMSRSVDIQVNVVAISATVSILTPSYTITHVNTADTDRSIHAGDTVIDTFPTTFIATGTANGQPFSATPIDYVWSIKSVSYSPNGPNLSFSPDSYSPPISGDPTKGGASGIMTAKFPSDLNHPAGYWKIVVHVHVDYTSNFGNGSAAADTLPYNGFSVDSGDFDISATMDATNSTIPLGGSGVASVKVTPLAGFDGTVNMSLFGAPEGMTGDIFTIALHADDPSAVQRSYNISVLETTKPGTYPVFITGSSGILNHGAGVTVTVPSRYAEITFPPHDPKNVSKTVPNNRLSNGSLTVDAAAFWIAQSASQGGWYGMGRLNTQKETGFLDLRTYQWTPTYGGHNADSSGIIYGGINGNSYELDDLLTETFAPPPGGLPVLGKSSSLSVDIKNLSGTKPYTVSYSINWHYPTENWIATKVLPDTLADEMYPVSQLVDANAGQCTVNIPNSTISWAGPACQAGSAVYAGAGAAVGTVGVAVLDLTLPEVGVLATLFAVDSVGFAAVAPAPQDIPVNTSYNGDPETSFDAALRQQRSIAKSLPNYVDSLNFLRPINDPTENRIAPSIASQINASNEYAFYSTGVTVKARAGRPLLQQTFNCDKYGPLVVFHCRMTG